MAEGIRGTPLYLLAAFIEKAVSGQSLFIPIRLKNRRELMVALYILTKQVTVGFLALVGANFLCILPQNISAFLPFGIFSMARISILSSYPGIEAAIADSVLLTGILLLLCWLLLAGQKGLLT